MTLSSSGAIRGALDLALSDVPLPQECALLDYPAYPNIGDHMIWLGEVLYLTMVRRVKIRFVGSLNEPLSLPSGLPILLSGGGNLGDLWPEHQNFRERIVSQYRNRPIVIMPQTMHFRDQTNLRKAAAAFNAHPDLTILIRDERSLETARQAFGNCRVRLTPDMAFELVGSIDVARKPIQKTVGLYHCRT
ncbi:MAG: polysaccharide pyruvyl transferase family protein, partial [Bryobacteraceae bacterium]